MPRGWGASRERKMIIVHCLVGNDSAHHSSLFALFINPEQHHQMKLAHFLVLTISFIVYVTPKLLITTESFVQSANPQKLWIVSKILTENSNTYSYHYVIRPDESNRSMSVPLILAKYKTEMFLLIVFVIPVAMVCFFQWSRIKSLIVIKSTKNGDNKMQGSKCRVSQFLLDPFNLKNIYQKNRRNEQKVVEEEFNDGESVIVEEDLNLIV
uniref:Uncharacterized protein n=2 Tax=Caenorhabditis japonica TaxID=281687 RepID=A0A8R1DKU1_CAEJA